MLKKITMLNMLLVGFCGVANGALQPLTSGQTITLNGKILNSLAFVSSDRKTTMLNITSVLSMFDTSVQSWFNAGNSVTFSVSAANLYGNGLIYSLQMMKTTGPTTDYAPLGYLNGEPSFEILCNGVSTGYYFGPNVTDFTIAPGAAYPVINVPAGAAVNQYTIPSLGSYFSEITSMSFVGSSGQVYEVGSVQVAALNQQYQQLAQNALMSIRIRGSDQSYVALFAGQSPYTLLQNGLNLGFPIKISINNELIATVEVPFARPNPNGLLLCALQK